MAATGCDSVIEEESSGSTTVCRGLGLAVTAFGSAVLFTLVKLNTKANVPALESTLARLLVAAAFLVPYMHCKGIPWSPPSCKGITLPQYLSTFVMAQGATAGLAFLLTFQSAGTSLGVGDAVTLYNTCPCFTPLISWLLPKDPLYTSHVLGVGFTLLGVLLLTQPPAIFGSSGGIELDG
jgi:drug/metabolite transporter (DMT)-like permease